MTLGGEPFELDGHAAARGVQHRGDAVGDRPLAAGRREEVGKVAAGRYQRPEDA
jgi:hypothetical protein